MIKLIGFWSDDFWPCSWSSAVPQVKLCACYKAGLPADDLGG